MRNACDGLISNKSPAALFLFLGGDEQTLILPNLLLRSILWNGDSVCSRTRNYFSLPPYMTCQAETSFGLHTFVVGSSCPEIHNRQWTRSTQDPNLHTTAFIADNLNLDKHSPLGRTTRAVSLWFSPPSFPYNSSCNVVGRTGHDCETVKPSLSVQCKRDQRSASTYPVGIWHDIPPMLPRNS